MTVVIDFENNSVRFPAVLRQLFDTLWWPGVNDIEDENLASLATYVYWKANLSAAYSNLVVQESESFREWMLATPEDPELPCPALPRLLHAAPLSLPEFFIRKDLTKVENRYYLLGWLHTNRDRMLPGGRLPTWVEQQNQTPGSFKELTVILEAHFYYDARIKEMFSCDTRESRLDYVYWAQTLHAPFCSEGIPSWLEDLLYSPAEIDTGEYISESLYAFWRKNEHLKELYPITINRNARICYLAWAAGYANGLFRNDDELLRARVWLETEISGLSGGILTRAAEAYDIFFKCNNLLNHPAPLEQQALALSTYVQSGFQYFGTALIKKLQAPFAGKVNCITNDLAGFLLQKSVLTTIPSVSAEELVFIGAYLMQNHSFLKTHGVPDSLQKFLAAPCPYVPDSETYGISNACYSLSRTVGEISALHAEESINASLCAYFDALNNLLPLIPPSFWQLRAWNRLDAKVLPVVPPLVMAYRAERAPGHMSLLGWFDALSGLGTDARMMRTVLKTASIHTTCVDVSRFVPHNALSLGGVFTEAPSGAGTIITLSAQDIYRLRLNSPQDWWTGRYNIGLCPWELPVWPSSAAFAVDMLDEIWAPSKFIANAFSNCGKPVTHMPHAVIVPESDGDLRSEFGISTETMVFLTAYDSNSSYVRKNPLAVVKAFNRAFAGSKSDVRLIIKTMNASNHPAAWQELRNENRCGIKVIFIDEAYPAARHARLLNTCDAFVSLHRSEGFGRLLAEAMSLNKLLIASDFGGNTDFATTETACPVSGKLIPVNEQEYLLAKGQQWFDANIEQAAQYMRDFAANPGAFAALAESGRRHILEHHSLETIGRIAKDALAKIAGLL